MIIKGGQRSCSVPFSSSSYPSDRRFFAVVERLLPHIPLLLLPTVFFSSPPPSSFMSLHVLLLVVLVFVFLFFIPRADMGVVYMREVKKSADLVDLSRQVSDVLKTCGGGKFDGCKGKFRPLLDDTLECVSESIMLQKSRSACVGDKPNKGKFRRCYHTH